MTNINKTLDEYFYGRIAFEFQKMVNVRYKPDDFQGKISEIRNNVFENSDPHTGKLEGEIADVVTRYLVAESKIEKCLHQKENSEANAKMWEDFREACGNEPI